MNIDKSKIPSMLFVALKYTPTFYICYLAIFIVLGFLTPIMVNVQKNIIDISDQVNCDTFPHMLIVIYFIIFYLDSISQNIQQYFSFRILNKLEEKLYYDYMNKLSALDYSKFENEDNHNIFFRIESKMLPTLSLCTNFIPNILRRLIELGGILFFVIKAGVWWAFPISILISIPAFFFNKKRVNYAREVWSKDNKNMRYAEYLNKILLNKESAKERKLLRFHTYISEKWDKIFTLYNKNKIKAFIKSSYATGIAMCFSMSIIIIYGVTLLTPLSTGAITIGLYTSLLVAITGKMNMAITAIVREYSSKLEIDNFIKDINQFHELLYDNNLEQNKTISSSHFTEAYDFQEKDVCFQSIRFEDVHFKYPHTETYILKGVSFEIKKNMQYILVGLNGAGKTTITKLMMGLYKPTKGSIYINGKNIDEYNKSSIFKIYAVMQQQFTKYKSEAAENIAIYNTKQINNIDRMDDIFKKCKIHEMKNAFNGNYKTMLSTEFQDGIMLSGGEWQKLAYARTMFADRDFIILDEPTAAFDPMAEIEFYQNYKETMGNKTCLFISHRLGCTFLFDKCLVVNNGVIAEAGTHKELMSLENGIYRNLFELQREWYKNENERSK